VNGRRVALIGLMHSGCDDRAGIKIDGVLGLVRQVRATVLHLGDTRLGIDRRGPIFVGKLLALAGTIHTNQILGARRLDA